jgi:hypothetical protein
MASPRDSSRAGALLERNLAFGGGKVCTYTGRSAALDIEASNEAVS